MTEYHKIQSVFKRDPGTKNKTLVMGDWSLPEFGYLANNQWEFTEKVDGCLHYANTVDTDCGRLPIGRIVERKLPVLVASYNEALGVVEYKDIRHFHREPRARPFIALTLESKEKGNRPKTVVCTENHKFFVGGEWRNACSLSGGMRVAHYADRLTEEQRQVLLGGLLGDASIQRPSATTRCAAFVHGAAQEEYLSYKAQLLGRLAARVGKHTSDGYCVAATKIRMTTRVNVAASKLIMDLCENAGRKRIGREWCDAMLPLGLAIWYMDDGSCHFPTKQRPRARFATNAFNDEEVGLLIGMLRDRFGIACDTHDYKGHTLVLTADGTERLFCIVAPYIADSMKYKIAKRYAAARCFIPDLSDAAPGVVDARVLSLSHKLPERFARQQSFQYDLTVDGNSNYFSKRVLVHNTNIRVMVARAPVPGATPQISFGGKTDAAQIPAFLVEKLQQRFLTIEQRQKLASVFPDGAVLYGEGYGARIQKAGANYRPDQDFVLFDVLVGGWWLERPNVVDVAAKLGIHVVPRIGCGTLNDMVELARRGFTSFWGEFQAEGIVARPAVELKTRAGHRIITKIKARDFAQERAAA